MRNPEGRVGCLVKAVDQMFIAGEGRAFELMWFACMYPQKRCPPGAQLLNFLPRGLLQQEKEFLAVKGDLEQRRRYSTSQRKCSSQEKFNKTQGMASDLLGSLSLGVMRSFLRSLISSSQFIDLYEEIRNLREQVSAY